MEVAPGVSHGEDVGSTHQARCTGPAVDYRPHRRGDPDAQAVPSQPGHAPGHGQPIIRLSPVRAWITCTSPAEGEQRNHSVVLGLCMYLD